MPRTATRGAAEARLMRLAAWLSARREPATREEIYQAFPEDYAGKAAAREKKWNRDKRDLNRLGIPVVFLEEAGEAGAYLVEPTACTLPRLEFPPAEAAVLWTAGWAAMRAGDHPLRDDLEAALRKLAVGAGGLPPRAAALEADALALERARAREWVTALAEAVERRRRLRLVYQKPGGPVTTREVDVYGYAWRRGSWIFVGWCHLREAMRLFLLERVRSLRPAPAGKGPDYRIPADFDIRAWSRQEPWEYLVHEPREAAIRFRGSLARIASQLLPAARFQAEPGGGRQARLTVRNLRGLVRQALAWGPEAELLEPAEGRAMAREILDGLAARLGES
ncbi:MAG TPA: WYL domain-containing protein [Anaeromyxobacteraceae bacterium]|nr:WYL domain-containing protein [Anaeromyxobacteraceae bacterium]